MITDDEAEKVAWEMRESAEADGLKRANRVHLEQFLKSKKALLMKKHEALAFGGMSIATQEREALADPEYLELLDGLHVAVFADEKARNARDAGKAFLDAWRTQQATERAAQI